MYYSEKIFENEFILDFNIKNCPNIKLYKIVNSYPYNYKSYGYECICDYLTVDEKTKNIFDKFDIKIFGESYCNENIMDIEDKNYFIDNKQYYYKSEDDYIFYNYISYGLEKNDYLGSSRYYDMVYIQFNNKKDIAKFKLMI